MRPHDDNSITVIDDTDTDDTTPPTVASVSPSNGPSGVAVGSSIRVSLSETMSELAQARVYLGDLGSPGRPAAAGRQVEWSAPSAQRGLDVTASELAAVRDSMTSDDELTEESPAGVAGGSGRTGDDAQLANVDLQKVLQKHSKRCR